MGYIQRPCRQIVRDGVGVERKHEHTMTEGSTSEQQKLYRDRNVQYQVNTR